MAMRRGGGTPGAMQRPVKGIECGIAQPAAGSSTTNVAGGVGGMVGASVCDASGSLGSRQCCRNAGIVQITRTGRALSLFSDWTDPLPQHEAVISAGSGREVQQDSASVLTQQHRPAARSAGQQPQAEFGACPRLPKLFSSIGRPNTVAHWPSTARQMATTRTGRGITVALQVSRRRNCRWWDRLRR
jgi:hypothetical protein